MALGRPCVLLLLVLACSTVCLALKVPGIEGLEVFKNGSRVGVSYRPTRPNAKGDLPTQRASPPHARRSLEMRQADAACASSTTDLALIGTVAITASIATAYTSAGLAETTFDYVTVTCDPGLSTISTCTLQFDNGVPGLPDVVVEVESSGVTIFGPYPLLNGLVQPPAWLAVQLSVENLGEATSYEITGNSYPVQPVVTFADNMVSVLLPPYPPSFGNPVLTFKFTKQTFDASYPCCTEKNKLRESGFPCRQNSCAKDAFCDGQSHDCPAETFPEKPKPCCKRDPVTRADSPEEAGSVCRHTSCYEDAKCDGSTPDCPDKTAPLPDYSSCPWPPSTCMPFGAHLASNNIPVPVSASTAGQGTPDNKKDGSTRAELSPEVAAAPAGYGYHDRYNHGDREWESCEGQCIEGTCRPRKTLSGCCAVSGRSITIARPAGDAAAAADKTSMGGPAAGTASLDYSAYGGGGWFVNKDLYCWKHTVSK